MRKKLIKLINTYFPNIKLYVIFTTNFKMKNLFKFKDKLSTSLRSLVVYKYKCNRYVSVYVGKTSRHLSITELLGISFRTGESLSDSPFNQISKHCKEHHLNEKPEIINFHI